MLHYFKKSNNANDTENEIRIVYGNSTTTIIFAIGLRDLELEF